MPVVMDTKSSTMISTAVTSDPPGGERGLSTSIGGGNGGRRGGYDLPNGSRSGVWSATSNAPESQGFSDSAMRNRRVVDQFCLSDGLCWQPGPVDAFCLCLPLREGTGLLATIGVCYNGLQLSLIWTWGFMNTATWDMYLGMKTVEDLLLVIVSVLGLYSVVKYHEGTARVFQYSWPVRIAVQLCRLMFTCLATGSAFLFFVHLFVVAFQLYFYKVAWSFYQEIKFVRAQARALTSMDDDV